MDNGTRRTFAAPAFLTSPTTIFLAGTSAASIALLASLWSWGLPLTNDGTAHVFTAFVAAHADDPRFVDHYDVELPITGRGFVDVQLALEPIFGWRTAWRINVAGAALVCALGFLAFVAALAPQRRWLGLLGFPLALNGFFYLGFVPFTWGTGIAWFVLAAWIARTTRDARAAEHVKGRPTGEPIARALVAHAALAVALYVVARIHIAPAALAGVLLVAYAVTVGGGVRAVARAVALLALAGIPALVVVAQASGASAGPTEVVDGGVVARLWAVFTMIPGGPAWRCALAAALAAGGVAGALRRSRSRSRALERGAELADTAAGSAIAGSATAGDPAVTGNLSARSAHSARSARLSAATAAVGLTCLLLAWVLPRDMAGWQFAGLRSAPFGLALLCAALPLDDRARVVRVATALALAAFVLSSFAWSFSLHARLREANAPVVALLDRPIAGADWTAVIMSPHADTFELPSFLPLMHVHHLFALENGGRVTYGHDKIPSAHALRPRFQPAFDPALMPRLDDPALVAGALRRQLSYAAEHELVIVAAPDDVLRETLAAGFVEVARSEPASVPEHNVLVARFEGCRGTLHVEPAAPGGARVAVGWWPRKSPTVIVGIASSAEPVSAPLPPLGCGEVWAAAVGATCAGQGDEPLRVTFTAGANNLLTCRLVPH